MTQAAGWYDDPQDPNQLRYWDGIIWSSHVSPKISPSVEQSTIGMPYGVIPSGGRPQSSGAQGAQGPSAIQDGFGSPRQEQQGAGGEWPKYGQGPGQQGQYGQRSFQPQRATTPDGVVLSGWWKRVLSRILDGLFAAIVAVPFAFLPMKNALGLVGGYFQAVMDAARAGSTTQPLPSAEMTTAFMQVSLIGLVVYAVYEIAFLTWRGATPGKMVVGISVRLRDEAGPPPLAAVLKRTGAKVAGSVFELLPVVGGMGLIYTLLDDLWPLWDVKKQAIHDKVAATNVVVGPQPKRGA